MASSMTPKHLYLKRKIAAALESEQEDAEGEFVAIMLVLVAEKLTTYPDADWRYRVANDFLQKEFHKAQREAKSVKKHPDISWALH